VPVVGCLIAIQRDPDLHPVGREQATKLIVEADRIRVHAQIEPTVRLDCLPQHFDDFLSAFHSEKERLSTMQDYVHRRESMRLRVFRDAQRGLPDDGG